MTTEQQPIDPNDPVEVPDEYVRWFFNFVRGTEKDNAQASR